MKTTRGTLNIPNDPTPWILVEPNQGKEWCVLWLQGWTSNIEGHLEGITRMAKTSGVSFAMLDYAGHGTHAVKLEESTREIQFNEVCEAYDELKRLGYQKIIVIGGSFGGYMAALLTGNRRVHATVLRAPANYPDKEFHLPYNQTSRHKNYYEHARAKWFVNNSSDNKALEAVKKFGGFTYVIEHELDEVVPQNIPLAYFEVAKHGNYLIVPATKHSPKLMDSPKAHFDYIEHLLISIIKAVQLQQKLT